MIGDMTAALPVSCNIMDILLGRQLSHQHQMKKPLGQRFGPARRLWQLLLQFRDGISTKTNTLLRVKQRGLGNQPGYTTHPLVYLGKGNLPYFLTSMLFDQFFNFGSNRIGF